MCFQWGSEVDRLVFFLSNNGSDRSGSRDSGSDRYDSNGKASDHCCFRNGGWLVGCVPDTISSWEQGDSGDVGDVGGTPILFQGFVYGEPSS